MLKLIKSINLVDMNKEKIISDLCTMYGAGYRGKVIYQVNKGYGWKGPIVEGLDLHQMRYFMTPGRLDEDLVRKGHKVYRNIHIPQRPFSDLLEKNEEGVCDLDKIFGRYTDFPSYVPGHDKKSGVISAKRTVGERADIVYFWDDGTYGLDGNRCIDFGGIDRFMMANGYKVPDSLKGEES